VQNNPVNWIDPFGLINIGKTVTGFLSMTDGITMVGTGIAATAGTAIATGNPYLTGIIGTYMVPVVAAGVWDTYHGAHMFWEGLWETEESEPCH
jgi:hypothetical protein